MPLFEHIPHPHIEARKDNMPALVAQNLPQGSAIQRFNSRLAVKITAGVGTMWCAYAFAAIALISLPAAIGTGNVQVIVSWVAQTFFQLVLLSVIIVGQNILAAASDKRAQDTYDDAEAVLHESIQIQEHLKVQDAELEKILATAASMVTKLQEASAKPGK